MIAWTENNSLSIGSFPALGALAPALRLWFTSRKGGVSAPPFDSLNLGTHVGDRKTDVLENRRRVRKALGIGDNRVARGGQVHGTGIEIVSRGGKYGSKDGFITLSRGLALAINSADCYPLVIHSPSEMTLAALHVGRSGAAAGIIAKAFEILYERFGIDPVNTVAACGPGICAGCYEVGRETAMTLPPYGRKRISGRWHADLPGLIKKETLDAGIREPNYFESNLCTSCEQSLFSYRRDGGRTGRNWTLAMMVSR
jgi:YfiH family protein